MKMTAKSTLIIASISLLVLLLLTIAISFLKVDRKVSIQGSFVFRKVSPVICEEEGFVKYVVKKENSTLSKGDTIIILENNDLEMEIKNSLAKLNFLQMELESILNTKEFDSNLNTLDITKLKEQLSLKKEEVAFLNKIYLNKETLLKNKAISREEFEESELKLKNATGEYNSLELQINHINNKLKNMDLAGLINYKLKHKEYEQQLEYNHYLIARKARLTIISPENGRILSDKMDNLKNTFLEKGSDIGDIVSFDDLNFIGYAIDADILRILPDQEAYFDVKLFRGKNLIQGKVKNIGYKPILKDGINSYPIEIEVADKKFFDRGEKLYLQAGVSGSAHIITEKNISFARLIWERMININNQN